MASHLESAVTALQCGVEVMRSVVAERSAAGDGAAPILREVLGESDSALRAEALGMLSTLAEDDPERVLPVTGTVMSPLAPDIEPTLLADAARAGPRLRL